MLGAFAAITAATEGVCDQPGQQMFVGTIPIIDLQFSTFSIAVSMADAVIPVRLTAL